MITPYDWQEGIGNRAQYIEGKLTQGSPVIAVSLDSGILIYTRRRQSRKIFEVYDRLAFSAVGQQSDVEALRSAAVEFAHQEGFNRSEQDVTIQRLVTALSGPVKKAFSDFSAAPLVSRSLFTEVNESPDTDQFYVLDYDGDYAVSHFSAVVAGTHEQAEAAVTQLQDFDRTLDAAAASEKLRELWKTATEGSDEESKLGDLIEEAMHVDRSTAKENRFRLLEFKS
ncbi:MAG: hypothetical protein H7Y17_12075 [Chlorobia bacterium]|nr:hypothetical protein [Fimbriimonadaceae bacterium]